MEDEDEEDEQCLARILSLYLLIRSQIPIALPEFGLGFTCCNQIESLNVKDSEALSLSLLFNVCLFADGTQYSLSSKNLFTRIQITHLVEISFQLSRKRTRSCFYQKYLFFSISIKQLSTKGKRWRVKWLGATRWWCFPAGTSCFQWYRVEVWKRESDYGVRIDNLLWQALGSAGISPLLQPQLEELARQPKFDNKDQAQGRKGKLVVIGHNCIEPLQALRKAGPEDIMDMKQLAEKQRNMENLRRKRKEKKKRLRVEKRDLNDVNNQVNSGAVDCCTSIISECLIETFPGCQVEVLLNSSSLDPVGFYKVYPAAWTAILVSLNNNYVANCAALICAVKP